ncbi:MAG: S41 family peptidase [Flavobacteriaceae bacterium]
MKNLVIKPKIIIFCFLFICIKFSNAQNFTLSKDFKDNTIKNASNFLKNNYVFKEIGYKSANYLEDLNRKGHFNSIKDLEIFAEEISKVIYLITNDKHISVSLKQSNQTKGNIAERQIESRMDERKYFRRNNGNFKGLRKINDNIGYLDLRGFYGLSWAKDFADYSMSMLSTSDAIIIDLRNNYGGRGDMVNYLLGHFFKKQIISGRSIKRSGDQFENRVSYSTKIDSTKVMPDVPVYILTSSMTFSAAEAFAFPMKIYKRATLIGEKTKGGANAGDVISLNKYLNIFIPDVAGKHPFKEETFDGEGVKPDILVRSGDALEVAINHAQKSAKEYRQKNDIKARRLLLELNNIITNFENKPRGIDLIKIYLASRSQNLVFEEWEINSLAFQNFEKKNYKTTEALLKVNTVLYPNSAKAFDSYARILLNNNKINKAISNFKKAISLSKLNDTSNLELYKKRLREAQKIKNDQK